MSRAALAVVIAIGVHVVLALVLAAFMHFSSPRELADVELDLSGVELSLSEEDVEAPPAEQPPPLPNPPPPEERRVPESVRPPDPADRVPVLTVPPEASSIELPEPDPEATVAMDLPPEEVEPEPEAKEDPLEEPTLEEDAPVAEQPTEEPPEENTPPEVRPEPSVEEEVPTPETAIPGEGVDSTQQPAPQQAKVDEELMAKHAISWKYPAKAQERGEEGDVVLELDVDARGRVTAVRLVKSSGSRWLDDSARKQIRSVTFHPAKVDGKPVPRTGRMTIHFQLKGRARRATGK